MKYTPMPSVDRLKELFTIDEENGILIRKQSRRGAPAGPVGCKNDRYWRCAIDGKLYLVHRVIWALVNEQDPLELEIDHINMNKHDNRPCNLRVATRSQQMANTRTRCTSKSGIKGIKKRNDKWLAVITVNKVKTELGLFDDKNKAIEAYIEAAKHSFGEFFYHETVCTTTRRAG